MPSHSHAEAHALRTRPRYYRVKATAAGLALIRALGGEALEVDVVAVHAVLEELGEVAPQQLELGPAVRVGVPAPRDHPEQLAPAVGGPLEPVAALHAAHHLARRHVRVWR